MPDAWVIALLVWIVVIPTTVALFAALVARRRSVELPERGSRPGEQPGGQLLHLASHAAQGAVSRSNSSGSGRRPAPGPRLRLERTR
jgi:hypothetical protein